MVAGFGEFAGKIKVPYVLIGGGVSEEQAGEIVPVHFLSSIPCTIHAYSRTKEFEVPEVWFDAPPAFKGGDMGTQVNATVVEVHRMEESCQPVF
jgi:hypothetical protein